MLAAKGRKWRCPAAVRGAFFRVDGLAPIPFAKKVQLVVVSPCRFDDSNDVGVGLGSAADKRANGMSLDSRGRLGT